MTTVLGSFSEWMTPDLIGNFSKAIGLDTTQAQRGLDVAGPLMLGSLAKKSQTVSGMDSIMRLLPDDTGPGFFARMLGAGGGDAPATPSMLTSVLGPGVSSIGKALTGRLGFNAIPLLSAAAPALLGMISKTAKEQKLNSADIAKVLQQDYATTLASAKPEVQAVLNEARQLGDRAERLKATFSDDEWNKIKLAPMAVTYYIITSSPSGLAGLSKEVIAAGEGMKSIVKEAMPSSLVDVAFGSFERELDPEREGVLDETAPRTSMLAVVRAATTAVKTKSPADAKSFADTMVALSRHVAEASKEGGFLGIGGTRVSEQEQRAIDEITAAVA